MCAIGDALYDYDNDIVKFRGLQSTINDHDGISWLQFMLDRLQQIPCTPCPTNVDGMDSEVLKELVRAWQEVHDEKMALYRHLVAVVRVHLDYRHAVLCVSKNSLFKLEVCLPRSVNGILQPAGRKPDCAPRHRRTTP